MVNPFHGEVVLTLDGTDYVMRLTLGALAELEQEVEENNLILLVQRFENSSFSARDLMQLLWAGLRGGGHSISVADLSRAEIKGGAIVAARAGAELLARAFADPV